MKQTQTQEISVENFVQYLKEKGVISPDTNVNFIITTKYYGQRDEHGHQEVTKIRLTKEVEIRDALL